MNSGKREERRNEPERDTPLRARELFGDRRELAIEFRGEIYRLRITRNEKLILTK